MTFQGALTTVQMTACAVMVFGLLWARWEQRQGVDHLDSKGLMVGLIAWLIVVICLPIDLVYALWTRDWASAIIDVLVAIYLWWVFFGGNGKWKRFKKRVKERVAVIKGRLKIVPVPVPA